MAAEYVCHITLRCSAHECLIYVCIIPCSPSTIDAVETKEGYSAVKKHLRKEMCIDFQVNTQN